MAAGAQGETVALGTSAAVLTRAVQLPTNVEGAFLDVLAQSQHNDEFWYTCVPDDVAGTVQSCGGTGFREVEVAIDGQPAGVAPVFAWIYTGGIDPYLWRPIPGVQALNLAPYRVDLTPFAGALSDGHAHTIDLRVFNADDYFSATATLLVYTDHGRDRVTGAVTENTLAQSPTPQVKEALTTATDGTVTGTVTVSAERRYAIAGYVDTSHGRVKTEVSGALRFSNAQTFDVGATVYSQKIQQETSAWTTTATTERGHRREAFATLTWPLTVDLTATTATDGSSTQTTSIKQESAETALWTEDGAPVRFRVVSNAVAPTDTLSFGADGSFKGPSGQSSSQRYVSVDSQGGCYSRSIAATSGKVTAVTDGEGCAP
jgi:hypothetical protein